MVRMKMRVWSKRLISTQPVQSSTNALRGSLYGGGWRVAGPFVPELFFTFGHRSANG